MLKVIMVHTYSGLQDTMDMYFELISINKDANTHLPIRIEPPPPPTDVLCI